jgi:hypothetical protein
MNVENCQAHNKSNGECLLCLHGFALDSNGLCTPCASYNRNDPSCYDCNPPTNRGSALLSNGTCSSISLYRLHVRLLSVPRKQFIKVLKMQERIYTRHYRDMRYQTNIVLKTVLCIKNQMVYDTVTGSCVCNSLIRLQYKQLHALPPTRALL